MTEHDWDAIARIGAGPRMAPKPKPPPYVPPPGLPSFDEANRAVPVQNDLDRMARQRLQANPVLWEIMVEGARSLIQDGKPFGVKLIAETGRHLFRKGVIKAIAKDPNSKFTWSNSYTAYVANLIAHHWPDIHGLIITKRRRP